MDIGVSIFPTHYSIRIDELAKELEARGFESLAVPEHTHIPACRRSPFPSGGEMPRHYWSTLDPFVGLMAAGAATERLRLITGIVLLTERDPIVCAKEAATLDFLTGGRLELGIGAGWNAEEMENHGTAFKDRFKVMCDRAKAMKVIWTQEEAEYHGPFVDFEPIWSYPKPVQQPIPIMIGGETRHSLRRIVDFCEGWLPRARVFQDAASEMARLKAAADEAGRDVDSIKVSVFGAEDDAAALASYREAGVHRALIGLPSADRDTVLPILDTLSKHID
tara:strand:+ start:691 stop:1524 length:834 start_codon:yes stop_codon:yes gene_type:complete